ncbi:hypothetical protein BDY24DRAFT_220603 [Mrakia frigida]|uniref:uncharacterized protein n=1 Tax=Mrakia frigida TaxID=29902 RepID=UPI003FCC0330
MNSWKALANLARDTIRTCNPEDTELIFSMFTLRHFALVSLHLPVHHTRELHLLFSAIAHLPPPIRNIVHSRNLIPFSLEVMLAKSRGGVDELANLLKRCKLAARKAGRENLEEIQLWKERGMRVGVVIAGVLVDSGDAVAALNLLSPLSSSPNTPIYVLSSIQRLLLTIGNLPSAALILERILNHPSSTETEKAMAQGFSFVAQGDNKSAQLAFGRVAEEREGHGDGLVAANASSVAALYVNELDRAISIIEAAIATSPSSTLIEPIIFNLATLYELRMGQEACLEKKVELLVKVAEWGGDGIRPACLKLS